MKLPVYGVSGDTGAGVRSMTSSAKPNGLDPTFASSWAKYFAKWISGCAPAPLAPPPSPPHHTRTRRRSVWGALPRVANHARAWSRLDMLATRRPFAQRPHERYTILLYGLPL